MEAGRQAGRHTARKRPRRPPRAHSLFSLEPMSTDFPWLRRASAAMARKRHRQDAARRGSDVVGPAPGARLRSRRKSPARRRKAAGRRRQRASLRLKRA